MKKNKILMILLFLFTLSGFAQQKTITGTVFDNSNTPLPGVNVKVLGTKSGVSTDFDGKFSVVVTKNQSLEFSSIGFITQTIKTNDKNSFIIRLMPSSEGLQEVVVVGYGVQKKSNLTGSLQTVKFDGAVNTPVTNASQLLYGDFSGVQLTQGGGLPGADASSIVIRGVGTFGGSNPLIIIDNVQYEALNEFNNLATSDIASITVLKDASATAIYGSRGGNGVILVTTKQGKSGVSSIEYNSFYGFQEVTVVPEYLNAVNYATLRSEYDVNSVFPATPNIRYTPANIQTIIDGSDPDRFANTNWAREILRTAPLNNHYLAFSGGTEKARYRLSLGYVSQEAVVRGKFKNERFNLGLNVNADVNSWLSISNVLMTYWESFTGPLGGAGGIGGETGIINQFQRSAPTVPVYYSNGNFGYIDGAFRYSNASFQINNAIRRGLIGDYNNDIVNITDRLGLNFKLGKGLTFETSGSLILGVANASDFGPRTEFRDFDNVVIGTPIALSVNRLANSSDFNYRLLNENILRYQSTFNKVNNYSFLLGHSVMYSKDDGFNGSLQNFPTDLLQEFSAGGILNPDVSGSSVVTTLQSFFSELNYNYSEKYLAKFSVRYDGSSKVRGPVPTEYYSVYPSASVGWVVSKENFLKNSSWIDNLKFRGSWGITGFDGADGVSNLYQTLNGGLDYLLGPAQTIVGGVAQTTFANPLLRWQKVTQYDLGLDIGLFKNKLTLEADYYVRNSKDVLYGNYPIPASVGITTQSSKNSASMTNRGIELSLNHRNNVGGFKYSIGINVTKNLLNEVTSLGENNAETISDNNIIRIGVPFRSYYGYKHIGIFQTPAQVAAAPVQFGNLRTAPGDLQFEDYNGDGKIDAGDRQVIGNQIPQWIYNFTTKMSYKWVDVSLLFQGVEGIERFLDDNGQKSFPDARNNALSYWIDRWTETNPSTSLPRLGGINNNVISDFFIEDASYLRIKNIEIGFTVPAVASQKFGIQKLRFYFSGQNLFTFTKFRNFDPERAGTGSSDLSVPLYKVYTLGINIKI